eukprot:scaffold58632_cov33-Tisochrysis_lutea.AAC.4
MIFLPHTRLLPLAHRSAQQTSLERGGRTRPTRKVAFRRMCYRLDRVTERASLPSPLATKAAKQTLGWTSEAQAKASLKTEGRDGRWEELIAHHHRLLLFVGQVPFPPDDQGYARKKKFLRERCLGALEQLQDNYRITIVESMGSWSAPRSLLQRMQPQ